MDGKKSWPFVLALAVAYAPRLLCGWIKRHVLRINPTGPNPSRWDGDKK